MITRRTTLVAPLLAIDAMLGRTAFADDASMGIERQLKDLERRSGGRLGVAVLETASGRLVGNRLDERFAMCSTFKALAVAYTLSRVDGGEESLDRRIRFSERDLVAPFKATKPHLAEGMTVEQLCQAALLVSDSTAANLLLASFGGPHALTAYLRSIGDGTTRLDNTEASLNVVRPGQTHNTSSPRAMAGTLRQIMLGNVLSNLSRTRLTAWMTASTDAATRRLRAGLPDGWRIANKPGTWEGISTNDVGVIFPPGRAPIVVAAFLGEATSSISDQEAILADTARMVSAAT